MVKRILLSIVMLMLIAYLGIAITAFNRKPADQTCRDVELVIKDTTYAGFITKEEVKGILQQCEWQTAIHFKRNLQFSSQRIPCHIAQCQCINSGFRNINQKCDR